MDTDAPAKALRLRLYVMCSECARLIDLAESDQQYREVEEPDLDGHRFENGIEVEEITRTRRAA
jgi:hypothetical protein